MVNTDFIPERSLSPIYGYPEEDAEFSDDDDYYDEDLGNQDWAAREDCVHVGVYSDNISIAEEFEVTFEEVHPVMVPLIRSPGLSECLVRWNGLADMCTLEDFLQYVHSYKERYNISDEELIGDLHFLFEGRAQTWWQNIETKPRKWTAVMDLMRNKFGISPQVQ